MTRMMKAVEGELVPMSEEEKKEFAYKLYRAEFAYLVSRGWIASCGVGDLWKEPGTHFFRSHSEAVIEQKKRDGLP